MKKQKKDRKKLLKYLEQEDVDQEKKNMRAFFESHCFEMVPYFWMDETHYSDIEVFFDDARKLHYVDWHGRRMYWKKGVRPWMIKKGVHALMQEQDNRSPHKYVLDDSIDGAYLADFGAAEGCFALDVIERVQHVYLFECDEGWIQSLRATFAPWEDKVTIVNKFIGNRVDSDMTTIDAFFADKPLDYVKADIEGAEIDMLRGGRETFLNKIRTANLCVYHRPTDSDEIQTILREYGFECQLTKGYLFVQQEQTEPQNWFRRGVVLGRRK
ncbi:MAG: FkbM family methyltransferase [Schwartzia sp.]|nr:FkbM family methyltransferase [Schwartzia sp. (in: firmicutes)]